MVANCRPSLILSLAAFLAGCDTCSNELPGVKTVDLPPIESFDLAVVQVPPFHPNFVHKVSSADSLEEIQKFLNSYECGWKVPTFGTYDDFNETRIELYSDEELVDIVYVGRNYFAREYGEIHIRRVDKDEIDNLEEVLGTGVRTVGHP